MLVGMGGNIGEAEECLGNKEWNGKGFRGVEVYGKRLGVMGGGRIGLGVGRRGESWG
ncbi:NAD(P)-dependent oxidoreductase, partial [Staphylococcus epidermidis]|uniref:NAD(P)-dependent oxidoreductase n=1 Tax=Staphylococcus epidermidis TaxID=1282 RepID=UPI0037DA4A7E